MCFLLIHWECYPVRQVYLFLFIIIQFNKNRCFKTALHRIFGKLHSTIWEGQLTSDAENVSSTDLQITWFSQKEQLVYSARVLKGEVHASIHSTEQWWKHKTPPILLPNYRWPHHPLHHSASERMLIAVRGNLEFVLSEWTLNLLK